MQKPLFSHVIIGSDHAGFQLKKTLIDFLKKEFPSLAVEDAGCYSEESVDYPTVGNDVATKVAAKNCAGILLCGSGIGVSIAANRVKGIRAALVDNVTAARLSRQHNDANIVCLGARLIGTEVAFDILRSWLTTPFEGGRHQRRVELLK
jgi:ribose 5-phosphate isomerase B